MSPSMEGAEKFGSEVFMRLRLRFGLRFLLISTTVTAAFIGLVERKAMNQRQLKQAVERSFGHFELAQSYGWLPKPIADLIGQDRSMHVVAVSLLAYEAPNFEVNKPHPYGLISTQKLRRILSAPAMKDVLRLKIVGTSVNGTLLPILSKMDQLNELTLQSSLLSRGELQELGADMPGCVQDFTTMAHVTNRLHRKFSEEVLPELAIFSLARDGQEEAIAGVIEFAGLHPEPFVAEILRSIEGSARSAIAEGLSHPSPFAQLIVLQSLTQQEKASLSPDKTESHVLATCLDHTDVAVRKATVKYLLNLPRANRPEGYLDLLRVAAGDQDAAVRELVGPEFTSELYTGN